MQNITNGSVSGNSNPALFLDQYSIDLDIKEKYTLINPEESTFNLDVEQSDILEVATYQIVRDDLKKNRPFLDVKLVPFDTKKNQKTQYSGGDIILSYRTQDGILVRYLIDIKWQTNSYFNNPTYTFAIELLANIKEKPDSPGWFLSKKATDIYAFCYPHCVKTIPKDNKLFVERPEDIFIFEIMFVDANSLKKYILTDHGFSNDELYDIAYQLKHAPVKRRLIDKDTYIYGELVEYNYNSKGEPISRFVRIHGLKFFHSMNIKEQPINIVIVKSDYENKMLGTKGFLYSAGESHWIKHLLGTSNDDRYIRKSIDTWQEALSKFKEPDAKEQIICTMNKLFGKKYAYDEEKKLFIPKGNNIFSKSYKERFA